MSDMKQVKVDNWGIYFLQRLKHFFNRTDYCDLTLQFQDNAQLKVHRLVLNACTEYFELLERTCEMYEDCLIMPEDLQADVVVPIVNFMYTGQLEFKIELLERLLQTSQIMNMPVLSKLLDAQRSQFINKPRVPSQSRQSYGRSPSTTTKRAYSKAFEPVKPLEKKVILPPKKSIPSIHTRDVIKKTEKSIPVYNSQTIALIPRNPVKKHVLADPRPTRYEVPEELDPDNIYDDSFHNISYETKPLMVHPETSKWYKAKKPEYGIFSEASGSRKFITENSTLDLVECLKISSTNNSLFEDSVSELEKANIFEPDAVIAQPAMKKKANELFDKAFDTSSGPKVTIEAEDPKQAASVDHAKIISEVLKKYPHLVNSNKNIKLKILENPPKQDRKSSKRHMAKSQFSEKDVKVKIESEAENTYEDVLNSKEAAKLIALGAENVKGPWICLICGTPGKALHFPQYYKFRRHLVEVHHEKPIPNICEYCGLKSGKRNYLLHHMYTKHGLPPPPNYHFPKCNMCNYVALTEGFLIKHKASHAEQRDFRCNVCFAGFKSSNLLLVHIQATGHKFCADRKPNLQCVYCLKVFLREANLFAHLKTNHKIEAKRDGIVEDSEEEEDENYDLTVQQSIPIKYEPKVNYDNEEDSNQFHKIQLNDNCIQVATHMAMKQKILNADLDAAKQIKKRVRTLNARTQEVFMGDDLSIISSNNNSMNEELMINQQDENTENIEEFYIPADIEQEEEHILPTSSGSIGNDTIEQNIVQNSLNKPKPIEIVMTNEQQLVTPSHPVIFDADGNPSKTQLAVLTTLDTASSNDMMILPDEYSLNVSEALNSKNSNIVVVYSHPMSDQNKPFLMNPQYVQSQIISSQDMGAFVSSSAVITPNFATIDTTAPIMSGQVVVSPPLESFEGDIHQSDVNKQVSNQHLPTLTNEQEADIITINPAETDTLNEMQLLQHEHSETQMITESTQITDVEKPGELVMVSEESVIDNAQNIVETSMEVDGSDTLINEVVSDPSEQGTMSDVIQQEVMTICDTANIEHKSLCETQNINHESLGQTGIINHESHSNNEQNLDEELPPVNIIETQTDFENSPDGEAENIVNNDNEDHNIEIAAATDPVPESPTYTQHEPDILQEQEIIEKENDAEDETIQIEVPVTAVEVPIQGKEQIKSLTSEWSEDEEDISACTQSENIEIISEQVNEETADSIEVEESIENIQHEIKKQMAHSSNDQAIVEVVAEDPTDQDMALVETLEATEQPTKTVAPQEKISSLLNEWEEIDSREGNEEPPQTERDSNNDSNSNLTQVVATDNIEVVATDNIETELKVIENNGSGETEIALQSVAEPKKVAHIKSLVSDWDEEDE